MYVRAASLDAALG